MNFATLKKIINRLLGSYVKKYFIRIFIALLLSLIVAGSTAAIAWLLDPAVKKIFIEQDQTMIILIPVAIVIAFASKGLSLYFARANVLKVGYEISRELQDEMSSSILKSDMDTIESKHSGKYISHFLYDVQLISNLVSTAVLNIMKDSLTLIVLLGLMFYQHWKLASFAMIMMPLAALIAKSLGKRIGKATSESAVVSGNLSTYLSELIKGSKVIKIYQQEKFEHDRSKSIMRLMMQKLIKIGIVQIRATPIMEILIGIIIASFIYYSGLIVATGEIQINNFFSFLTAMMLAYQPIRSLATINMVIYQGAAAAERVFGVIDTKINIKEIKNSPDLKVRNANIEFSNVSFKYPKTESHAVKEVSLSINGGEIVALVGHSGAGKSTILNLIPRFYDPSSGQITIDKQKISEVSLYSLRKNISLVSQDIVLFDDTVQANIAYAKQNASKEQIDKACEFAAAKEFIENLPKSYQTVIGENGVRLSGGQKQRISIARAILKDAPIILLDEATSSLDADSEEKVQNAIMNLTKNKTTLVIAHRLSTIIRANKIIVLHNGEVVDIGTHSELLNKSGVYKNLYSKQIATN